MNELTTKQLQFLIGVQKAHYPCISASEAGDPEIGMLIGIYVDMYWGIGGNHLALTDLGKAEIDRRKGAP
jgi:hypothetical protein